MTDLPDTVARPHGPLSPAQLRGARAMLNWSMAGLAQAARVSVSTVKRMEDEDAVHLSPDMRQHIRATLEQAGLHFEADAKREGVWRTLS